MATGRHWRPDRHQPALVTNDALRATRAGRDDGPDLGAEDPVRRRSTWPRWPAGEVANSSSTRSAAGVDFACSRSADGGCEECRDLPRIAELAAPSAGLASCSPRRTAWLRGRWSPPPGGSTSLQRRATCCHIWRGAKLTHPSGVHQVADRLADPQHTSSRTTPTSPSRPAGHAGLPAPYSQRARCAAMRTTYALHAGVRQEAAGVRRRGSARLARRSCRKVSPAGQPARPTPRR